MTIQYKEFKYTCSKPAILFSFVVYHIYHLAGIIESEEHVILHCPLYNDLKMLMFDHAENVNPDFII